MRTPGFSGTLAFTEGVFQGPVYGPFAFIGTNATVGAITGTVQDVTGSATQGCDFIALLLTGVQAGGVNYTLPSVASIIAAEVGFGPQDIIGWQYRLRIVNVATTQIITVVAGAGWTLAPVGTYTIANNTYRDFVVQITSPTTAVLTNIGTGTFS